MKRKTEKQSKKCGVHYLLAIYPELCQRVIDISIVFPLEQTNFPSPTWYKWQLHTSLTITLVVRFTFIQLLIHLFIHSLEK